MTDTSIPRRIVYLLACVLPVWAMVALYTGGVGGRLGPLRLSSREPWRPLLTGVAIAAWYVWRYRYALRDADGRWLMRHMERAVPWALASVVVLGLYVGIRYGSFAAAGSDSYGYVSQARLWMSGTLRVEQPWVTEFSWPNREWMFAPLGYRPYGSDGTIVPTYPPGLSMMMALCQALLGANGPFYIVPVAGALLLWVTYALGRDVTGSRGLGVVASALLLASPVFLAHVMWPMSDVPAAAGWALVCLLLLKGGGVRHAAAAGCVAGLTLLIRPNLFPLALMPLALWRPLDRHQEALIRYATGLAPGLLAIFGLNVLLYGAPLTFGYGRIFESYSVVTLPANVRNYATWLVQTETLLIALAAVPFLVRGVFRTGGSVVSPRACLGAVMALTFVSYVFYAPFDHWYYLRFLLPAYPALLVSLAASLGWLCSKLPMEARAPVGAIVCAIVMGTGIQVGRTTGIFTSADYERRHIRAAAAVASETPENAVVLAVQHSGSVRYYAHRVTLRYDWLADDQLDVAVHDLALTGRPAFVLVDNWEEKEFKTRFAPANRLGGLDWAPIERIAGPPEVRLYQLR